MYNAIINTQDDISKLIKDIKDSDSVLVKTVNGVTHVFIISDTDDSKYSLSFDGDVDVSIKLQ